MQPNEYNRSARHWQQNILATKEGPVNSGPTDTGQGSRPKQIPRPQTRGKHTPMDKPQTISQTKGQLIVAALGIYVMFLIWMSWMNFEFIYLYTIGSRFQSLIILQEITITLFLIGGLHLVFVTRGKERLMAVLPFIVAVLIIFDRAGLAAIYTKGIIQ